MSDSYAILNGNLIEGPLLGINNRAFCYGDSLFETIRTINNQVPFLHNHILRLSNSMKLLRMEMPQALSENILKEQLQLLLQKNNIQKAGRIRLQVYRNEGGYYTPETNHVSYIIEAHPIKNPSFTWNAKGLIIDIYDEIKKPITVLSNLKTNNCLLFVMAGIYKKSRRLDECVILNTSGNVCEMISSNIFLIKQGILFTPPLTEGCINGIMRQYIIELALKNNIKVVEKPVVAEDLTKAEEIFLTNAIQGIQWVSGYKNKRYFSTLTKKLVEMLLSSLV